MLVLKTFSITLLNSQTAVKTKPVEKKMTMI